MAYFRYFKVFIFIGIYLLLPSPVFHGQAFPKEKETDTPAIGYFSARITWLTDERATSQVEYGTEESKYEHVTEIDKNLVNSHEVILNNLIPSTLYHYRVISEDKLGNKNVSNNFTFKTLDISIADKT
ncbi:MAG: fibronectin type III domain-containing protein, partial [Candidatus Omnitrophica bacterium]|nr:fibronectin type III domain-containing protein [Candidatus Omnitrophota bacterium]